MLHLLRGRNQRGVQRRAFELFHRFLTFFDEPLHTFAGLAPCGHAQKLEHLFEPSHLHAGDFEMLLERCTELIALGCLGHLRQRLHELLFRVVDVLEFLDEQFLEIFSCHFASFHKARPWGPRDRLSISAIVPHYSNSKRYATVDESD